MARLSRGASGAPVWPLGVIGSLAHDENVAVAAVALLGPLAGLGVDTEAAAPLPTDLVEFVLHGEERRHAVEVAGRLVFAAKEAVYKAIHPLDGSPLEYADIFVRLDAMTATLRDGRVLRLFAGGGTGIVAVAAFVG